MILDTSAIVALFLKEPGHEALLDKLASAAAPGIGTPTLTETTIVLEVRLRRDPRAALARFLQAFRVTPVPFGEAHWHEAARAWREFGKGRHPAALNLGDCMSYAVARLSGQPLLCKGQDFPKTDLALA